MFVRVPGHKLEFRNGTKIHSYLDRSSFMIKIRKPTPLTRENAHAQNRTYRILSIDQDLSPRIFYIPSIPRARS